MSSAESWLTLLEAVKHYHIPMRRWRWWIQSGELKRETGLHRFGRRGLMLNTREFEANFMDAPVASKAKTQAKPRRRRISLTDAIRVDPPAPLELVD